VSRLGGDQEDRLVEPGRGELVCDLFGETQVEFVFVDAARARRTAHHQGMPDIDDGAERMAVAGRGLLFCGWCRLFRGRRLAPRRASEERQSNGEKRDHSQMRAHAGDLIP
jgi:hypothetical protein